MIAHLASFRGLEVALGLLSLPVIIIGDKRLTGFNPNAIDAALNAS